MDRTAHLTVSTSQMRRSRARAGIGLGLATLLIGLASGFAPGAGQSGAAFSRAELTGALDTVASAGRHSELVALKVEAFDLAKFGPASYGD